MQECPAGLTKYAANTFLATKITFINEMANFCDLTGEEIDSVCLSMELSEADIQLSVVNPKQVKYHVRMMLSTVKTYTIYAKLLSMYGKKIPSCSLLRYLLRP
ncbi:hypothetical protein [Bacteroidetes bacterium endosymbiont of Geopemphigus sp.]|uniref:hypothetical protein n=1 Tax=Bacteroidetes bacterium endosymbiont of Geopemphigus sp. TaxID=2047937 RepID=UPI000CD2FE28|nr:hypothetical protein [Bacteroidetes bacterium endosymbiont of Geopemphigus sp.]